ncbi:MAG: DNA replication/repair protein RecF [Microthrixaceae bacterium]|nr:DNA replication/repair protein RecF [Microthrixaceae bacterium]
MTARPVMRVERLELLGFRSYRDATVDFAPRFTAVLGENGQGKTNLLEAIGYLSRLSSFRGAPPSAMVAASQVASADQPRQAVIRGQLRDGRREVLVEAELPIEGRPRVLVNRQPLRRRADLLKSFQVSVFMPDDLELVKEGPALRRSYLDEILVSARPSMAAVVAEVDKILRQRNVLLKQVGRRLSSETTLTLDVWDERLDAAGSRLAEHRVELLAQLQPYVIEAYDKVASRSESVTLRYLSSWREMGLADALRASRDDDVRRQVSLVGPHRDDMEVRLAGMDSRHQASQGEQRSLAFALRLAAHRFVTDEIGVAPVLLLDDIFSELDPGRSAALLGALPEAQVILTSATPLPKGADPELVLEVHDGSVTAAG